MAPPWKARAAATAAEAAGRRGPDGGLAGLVNGASRTRNSLLVTLGLLLVVTGTLMGWAALGLGGESAPEDAVRPQRASARGSRALSCRLLTAANGTALGWTSRRTMNRGALQAYVVPAAASSRSCFPVLTPGAAAAGRCGNLLQSKAYAVLAVSEDPADIYLSAMTSTLWRQLGRQSIVLLMGSKRDWLERIPVGKQLVELLRDAEQTTIFVSSTIVPGGMELGAFAEVAPICGPILRILQPHDTVLLTYPGLLPVKRHYFEELNELSLAAPRRILVEQLPPGPLDEAPVHHQHSLAIGTVSAWRTLLALPDNATYSDCVSQVLDAATVDELRQAVGAGAAAGAATPASVLKELPSDMLAQLLRYKARRLLARTAGPAPAVTVAQLDRDMARAEMRGPPKPWRVALGEAYAARRTFFPLLVDVWAGPPEDLSLVPTSRADAALKWGILKPLLQTVLPGSSRALAQLATFHETFVAEVVVGNTGTADQ